MSELIEEKVPKHMIGVRDPGLKITYWVFSDHELSFESAKKAVADFRSKRIRDGIDPYLPSEVILKVGPDNQVEARGLPSPEELSLLRQILEQQKKE